MIILGIGVLILAFWSNLVYYEFRLVKTPRKQIDLTTGLLELRRRYGRNV